MKTVFSSGIKKSKYLIMGSYENCWKTEGRKDINQVDFYEIIKKNQRRDKECSIF